MLKKLLNKQFLNFLLFAWSGLFTLLVFHTFAVTHASNSRADRFEPTQQTGRSVMQPAAQPATQPANPAGDRQQESGY